MRTLSKYGMEAGGEDFARQVAYVLITESPVEVNTVRSKCDFSLVMSAARNSDRYGQLLNSTL